MVPRFVVNDNLTNMSTERTNERTNEWGLFAADVCVDDANAPSLHHVACQLDHGTLRSKTLGHMIKHLVEVQKASPFFASLVDSKLTVNTSLEHRPID